jgi:exodeoxyribonuclease VII small subunit
MSAKKADTDTNEQVPFESILEQLEGLVKQLEEGELSLEESLAAFEKGMALARKGGERLTAAEERVEILMAGSNEPVPFDSDQGNE